MDSCPSNSYKSREESALASQKKKQINKVTKGTVKTKKKNEMSKLGDIFISEDASKVKSYILMDVLVPAIKKAISDIVTNGIDMMLYGESGRTKKRSSADYVSYNRYYDRRDRDERYVTKSRYSYDDIIFESRAEAEEVLDRMSEIIDTYGAVSVADLYDLVDVSGTYTDNNYGWDNLRNAEAVRVRDGYILKLPKITALK